MKTKKVSKDLNTIKSFIINYISLKILNKNFEANSQIPSENILAEKFGCSRLTARSAIIVLVHMGILYPIKGSGHYVSENAIKILLPTLFISMNTDKIVSKSNGTTKELSKYYSQYFKKDKLKAEVYWTFAKRITNFALASYKNEEDFSFKVINSGILGVKVCESLVNIDNKTFIKHTHYDEKDEFLFEFSLWYDEIEEISSKTYIKL